MRFSPRNFHYHRGPLWLLFRIHKCSLPNYDLRPTLLTHDLPTPDTRPVRPNICHRLSPIVPPPSSTPSSTRPRMKLEICDWGEESSSLSSLFLLLFLPEESAAAKRAPKMSLPTRADLEGDTQNTVSRDREELRSIRRTDYFW